MPLPRGSCAVNTYRHLAELHDDLLLLSFVGGDLLLRHLLAQGCDALQQQQLAVADLWRQFLQLTLRLAIVSTAMQLKRANGERTSVRYMNTWPLMPFSLNGASKCSSFSGASTFVMMS